MTTLNLHTKRLILKGLSPEDINSIFQTFTKEEVKQLMGHSSDDEYAKEAEKVKQGYAAYNRRFILFLLIEKSSQKIIGRCGLHNWNVDHQRAEIGYTMSDSLYKQKGLMTEAVEAILTYGFENLKLNRIEALVATDNTPSLKIIEKFNFKKEGLLRKHYNVEGTYKDSLLFSKLKSEHESETKNV